MQANRRNPLIDAFRGISITAVVLFHFAVVGLGYSTGTAWNYGRLGVEVFFAISGFVITMTALRSANALEFSVRRFARIYPTFLVACTLTFFVVYLYDPAGFKLSIGDYFASWTFAPDRFGYKYVDGAYWSLFVEVLFYAVVAMSITISRSRFWLLTAFALVFGAFSRIAISKVLGVLLIAPYSGFFLLGMAAWYASRERNRTAAIGLIVAAAACLALDPLISDQWPALVVISFMFGLYAIGSTYSFGPMAWLGRLSYSLYLLHQNIGVEMIRGMRDAGVPSMLAALLSTGGVTALAYLFKRYVEDPSHDWFLKLTHRTGKPGTCTA